MHTDEGKESFKDFEVKLEEFFSWHSLTYVGHVAFDCVLLRFLEPQII